jgi:hypothetical protein
MSETLPEQADDAAGAKSFLEPSAQPGSLGRLAHYEVIEVLGMAASGRS